MKTTEKNNLGRGLAALLGDVSFDYVENTSQGIKYLNLSSLVMNENQPRKHFDDEALQALANSITKKGLISPIVVRKVDDEKYEIIAGERRFRAAKLSGFEQIPVIIRDDIKADGVFELALIENLQRQDLSVVEEATAYKHLIDKYSYTQDTIADIVGKSRSHITNILRALTLPDSVLNLLNQGKITFGHAKALLGTSAPQEFAIKVVEHGWSVRQLEKAIKDRDKQSKPKKIMSEGVHDDLETLASLLSSGLDTKVTIKPVGSDSGTVMISYRSLEQLDKILQVFSTRVESGYIKD